jgi:hypothetical protein
VVAPSLPSQPSRRSPPFTLFRPFNFEFNRKQTDSITKLWGSVGRRSPPSPGCKSGKATPPPPQGDKFGFLSTGHEQRTPPTFKSLGLFPIPRRKSWHRRMGRGGHGLPKVSHGPAMPNPSTLCERATPETALRPFLGWPAHRAGGLRPSSSLLDTPRHTPMKVGAPLPVCARVGCAKEGRRATVGRKLPTLGQDQICKLQFKVILEFPKTPCGRPLLEWPTGQVRDGHQQGVVEG